MNLNFYRYVTVIAETGSLSTASERLFITQSALTQALKKMEQTFGGPLFIYQNRSMQLTPLGQIVLETAMEMEEASLQMTNSISQPEAASAGHLSVAVNIQTGSMLVGKVFARFHQRYPDLMVHFLTASTKNAKKLLDQKAVDLIYCNEFEPSNSRITQRLLYRENILLAIDRRTARQAGLPTGEKLPWKLPPVDISRLSQLPFIVSFSGAHFRHLADSYLKSQHVIPYIVCETSNFLAAQIMAADRVGISLIPSSLADYKNPELLHFHLKTPLTNPLVVAYRADCQPTEEMLCLIQLLEDFCRSNGENSLL